MRSDPVESPARDLPLPEAGSRLSKGATSALGGLLGGLAGAALVIAITEVLKGMLAVVARQSPWALIVLPLLAIVLLALTLWLSVNRRRTADNNRLTRPYLTLPGK